MLELKNGYAGAVIVLHEIYGVNRHMRSVCRWISESGRDVFCPDLLGKGKTFDYPFQQEAYRYFMQEVGFGVSSRVNELIDTLKQRYAKVVVVGYSVGATLAWLCAAAGRCDGIVGFYGSRIRDYTDISPKCPATLLFASRDAGCNSADLAGKLKDTANTEVTILDGKHGFCDLYSENYQPDSARTARLIAEKFITSVISDGGLEKRGDQCFD